MSTSLCRYEPVALFRSLHRKRELPAVDAGYQIAHARSGNVQQIVKRKHQVAHVDRCLGLLRLNPVEYLLCSLGLQPIEKIRDRFVTGVGPLLRVADGL